MARSQRSLTIAVGDALGSAVSGASRLGGGDVAESYRLALADGRSVFAKTHAAPPPRFFTTEAAGLRWLQEPGAVAVPEVLAVSDDDPPFLVLAWVDEGGAPSREIDATFGRQLAALHRSGSPTFGREDRRSTGSRGLPNEPCATWVEFFTSQRLEPLLRIATDERALPHDTLVLVRRVIDRLDELGGPPEPPARPHGDLWAGNRLVDATGRSWIIDPAAHGGHREFDLAMMQLFGGYGPAAFDAYHEVHPLAGGWRDRVPLHQLAPLIVHAIKFGGGYRDGTRRALERLLG